jgi:tRNA (cytidine56-2'-O)-methyltransferase
MGVSWRDRIRAWKHNQGEVIHLTMYGIHVDDAIAEIRASSRDKLVVVGGPKVPAEVFDLADYNVAIGNQPHSEVAALAVFLDRLFQGDALRVRPQDADFLIEPMRRGKRVQKRES